MSGKIIYSIKLNRSEFDIYQNSGTVEVSGNCSGTYDNVKKEITTPNYPRVYAANKTCYWNIDASPGSRIELRFIDFRLEISYDCSYGYLQIYDGGNLSVNALGPKHCGSTIPSIQISLSNRLYLEWRSDGSEHFSGFKISVHSTGNSQLYGNLISSLRFEYDEVKISSDVLS